MVIDEARRFDGHYTAEEFTLQARSGRERLCPERGLTGRHFSRPLTRGNTPDWFTRTILIAVVIAVRLFHGAALRHAAARRIHVRPPLATRRR